MAASFSEGVNLLLLGRTGNGKSSTGNSILGGKEFTPQSCTSSVVTYDVKAATGSVKDVPVTVVEGPGLGDTDIDVTDDGQSMIGLSQKAMSLSSHRFHALLVVLKYGVRFTNQEKEAVRMIKTIFGEDVIKNYGIIVMTYGDSFDLDMENEGVTFETWCDAQTGDFRDLFDECDNRCVLFDNKSKETGKVEKQREQLMNLVSGITQHRLPYNDEDFAKAEPSRKVLIVKGKLPELELKTESILSYIHKRIDEIRESDPAEILEELQKLVLELEDHKQFLNTEDMRTGLIRNLLTNISISETRIKTLSSSVNLRMIQTGLVMRDQQKHSVKFQSNDDGADKDKKDRSISYCKVIFLCLATVGGIVGIRWVVRTLFLKRMIR